MPLAGGVATLWTVARFLKLTSSQKIVGKLSHKNENYKIQVVMPERSGILRKKTLFGWKAWYADIGWEGESVFIYLFNDAEMKKIARKILLGRYVSIFKFCMLFPSR